MIARAALLLLALTAARDDPLAGRTAGVPQDCIDIDRVQGPDIRDAGTILYRQNRQRIWRASADGACTAMRPGDGLIVETRGRKVCRGDRFHVRSAGYVSASVCRFGRFVPYDKAP